MKALRAGLCSPERDAAIAEYVLSAFGEEQSFFVYLSFGSEVGTEALIRALLARGKTVIMIAHRLSTVANADCIYVIDDGRVAEYGKRGDLCAKNGLFSKMWNEYQTSAQWKVSKEG